MSDDVAVYWLEAASTEAEDQTDSEQAARALSDWALARGVRLTAISPRAPSLVVDVALADQAEKELERAREAMAASDTEATERALSRAETLLREHPELPQAAWLRAEVDRAWSARWLRLSPRDEERARAASEDAQALDGGRVAGVGETNLPARPRVRTTLLVKGPAAPRVTLRLDGTALERRALDAEGASYAVDVAPGEHHVTASVDDRLAFASWVGIGSVGSSNDASPPIILHVGSVGPCSGDAFGDVKRVGGRIEASGVTCPQWVAAIPGPRQGGHRPTGARAEGSGGVLVARCERDACGPLLEWRLERFDVAPPASPPPRSGWPSWATWTLVGIGAAAATSLAVVASGVFDARPVEPRFVVGGARTE